MEPGFEVYDPAFYHLIPQETPIERIAGDADRLAEFAEEQRKKLKQMLEASELEVRVAITKAYRYLYYPSADAPHTYSNLARETLPAQDQGEVSKDQSA
ncbi:MAG: hypothetical protein C4289_10055, partial [Chloroflexota bacterium]